MPILYGLQAREHPSCRPAWSLQGRSGFQGRSSVRCRATKCCARRKGVAPSSCDHVVRASRPSTFGSTVREHDRREKIINTRQYRGPEVILELGWDEKSDIWSAGCILIELYTGEMLFGTHENMEHLALVEQILAPLPSTMIRRAHGDHVNKSSMFKRLSTSKEESRWALNWPAGASSDASIQKVASHVPIEELLQQRLRSEARSSGA